MNKQQIKFTKDEVSVIIGILELTFPNRFSSSFDDLAEWLGMSNNELNNLYERIKNATANSFCKDT